MRKIYDIAFRMGVLFNVLLWTILNLVTLFEARRKSAECEAMNFAASSCYFYDYWGFPFRMFYLKEFFVDGIVLLGNAVIYVFGAFFFGFLFKYVWSAISCERAGFDGTPSS